MLYQDTKEEFLLDQKIRGNSPLTIQYYLRVFQVLEEYHTFTDTKEITLLHCKRFFLRLSERDLSSVSIQTYVRGFRAYLSWLFANGYVEEDLSRRFKLPKAQRKTIDVLTDDELRRLVDCFDTGKRVDLRNLCICALMFDSGLRRHEIVSLQSEQVHLEDKYLIVNGKGNKQRIVPIGATTGAHIRKYIRTYTPGTGSFFTQEDGTPITDDTLKDLFRKLKGRAGIPRLHPHLLRHTFATRYLENGGDIYSLQAILGHTSLEMVKRYLHLATSRIRATFSRHSPFDNLGSRHHDFLP